MTVNEEMKRCPFCGEEILAVAIKCKHCKTDLTAELAPQTGTPSDFGAALLAIPVAAALLTWFWVGNMNFVQSPASCLWLLMIVTIVGTATIATIENGKATGSHDFKWLVTMCLVWIVAYPAYMKKRAENGLKDLLVPAVIAAIGLLASALYVGNAIVTAQASLAHSMGELEPSMEPAQPADIEATTPTLPDVTGEPADSADESHDSSPATSSDSMTGADAPATYLIEPGAYEGPQNALLTVSSLEIGRYTMTVVAGSSGADRCPEGWVDCLELHGKSQQDGAGYLFTGDSADCEIRMTASAGKIGIGDVTGTCGTGTGNRQQLTMIRGDYAPRQLPEEAR